MKYMPLILIAIIAACGPAGVEQTPRCEIYNNCSNSNIWGTTGKNIWGQ